MTKADAEALSRIAAAHGVRTGVAPSVSSVSCPTDPGAMCALLCAALARAMDAGAQFTCFTSTQFTRFISTQRAPLCGTGTCDGRRYSVYLLS